MKFRSVEGEQTFIGNVEIVDQHLSNQLINSSLIKRTLYRLKVDTDIDITLDLLKDLYLDKELLNITNIENYSNVSGNRWLRRFNKGISSIDFYLTCAYDKVPEINRSKTNGLGIEFKTRDKFPV